MSWDVSGRPHQLAVRRSGPSELEPERLPEVRELAELGWFLAPEAPMWVFLPYVWPRNARTWVPDRSTCWEIDTTFDAAGQLLGVECRPVSAAEKEVQERDAAADLDAAGIPPRPSGRLWLLRPVGGFDDLDAVLDHLCTAAEDRDVPVELSADFARLCQKELRVLAGRD
ncbi:DUF5956 family protein [Streptomyces sp. NPDC002773]|uniref:DUF5956 family protein n=1 Tax=Streptomyces sp. NPDC002773 TaxID=3154430 RepID=UPI0033266BB9